MTRIRGIKVCMTTRVLEKGIYVCMKEVFVCGREVMWHVLIPVSGLKRYSGHLLVRYLCVWERGIVVCFNTCVWERCAHVAAGVRGWTDDILHLAEYSALTARCIKVVLVVLWSPCKWVSIRERPILIIPIQTYQVAVMGFYVVWMLKRATRETRQLVSNSFILAGTLASRGNWNVHSSSHYVRMSAVIKSQNMALSVRILLSIFPELRNSICKI